MFLQARRYYICCCHLGRVNNGLTPDVVALPALHLSYLSTEVYLKFLCYKHVGEAYPKQTHDIKKIFDQLKPHVRSKIRKKFKPELAKVRASLDAAPNLADGSRAAVPEILEEALEFGYDFFSSFRYSWEGYPRLSFVLYSFPETLDAVALEMYPEFQVYGDLVDRPGSVSSAS